MRWPDDGYRVGQWGPFCCAGVNVHTHTYAHTRLCALVHDDVIYSLIREQRAGVNHLVDEFFNAQCVRKSVERAYRNTAKVATNDDRVFMILKPSGPRTSTHTHTETNFIRNVHMNLG